MTTWKEWGAGMVKIAAILAPLWLAFDFVRGEIEAVVSAPLLAVLGLAALAGIAWLVEARERRLGKPPEPDEWPLQAFWLQTMIALNAGLLLFDAVQFVRAGSPRGLAGTGFCGGLCVLIGFSHLALWWRYREVCLAFHRHRHPGAAGDPQPPEPGEGG